MVKISKTEEFIDWFSSLRAKEQAQIEARLYRIHAYGHFGDCSSIEGTGYVMAELRWKNGWRVYFYRENIDALNLPRLKAKDSCFVAPSNPGSSTGFRPTFRRPLSLRQHCDPDGFYTHSCIDILSHSVGSHSFSYTGNIV
jgi:putative component of toxin-antitoxin plasmid stabilization module